MGSPGRKAATSASLSRLAGGVWPSGVPPESSATMAKRCNSAATRRASARSPVTSAARFPGSFTACRSAMAIAAASSRSLAASTSVTPASASVMSVAVKRALAAPHSSVVSAGRNASPTSAARRANGFPPSSSTSRRVTPSRPISLARPYCGWPSRAGRASAAEIAAKDASSIVVSRPGSTTAPSGRPAMAASSSAVAGMEPVEPAAMTGPGGGLRRSRAASSRISALRWAAGLERSRSSRIFGQFSVTIFRKSSVTCHHPARLPVTRSASLVQSEPSVSASSIRAARSRASHRASAAEAGTTTSSWKRAATSAGSLLFHSRTSGARASRRSIAGIGGASSRAPALSGASASNRTSSSSNSPSGRMTGRIADLPPMRSTKTPRSARAARRVGT